MNCQVCNDPITPPKVKYCSKKCNKKYHKLQRQIKEKNSPELISKFWLRKKIAIVRLMGGCCSNVDCRYSKNLACLSFHHKDPTKKKFELTLKAFGRRSMKTLLKEAKKCQLLCMNCHGDHHHPQYRDWEQLKEAR